MDRAALQYHIVSEIKTHHRAQVPFELSRAQLVRLAELFLDVIELPNIAEILPPTTHPLDPGSIIGYVRRVGTTPVPGVKATRANDVKTFIHYHPELFDQLYAKNIKAAPAVVNDWLARMREVHAAGRLLRDQILDALELTSPGISRRFFADNLLQRDYTRLLAYDVPEKRHILADGHNDRGPIALGLAESAPGLRFGPPGDQHEIVHEDGKAIFQPGCAFDELGLDFAPAWHDVLYGNQPPARKNVSRWAIVYFADHHGKRNVTWEEAHTPVSRKRL